MNCSERKSKYLFGKVSISKNPFNSIFSLREKEKLIDKNLDIFSQKLKLNNLLNTTRYKNKVEISINNLSLHPFQIKEKKEKFLSVRTPSDKIFLKKMNNFSPKKDKKVSKKTFVKSLENTSKTISISKIKNTFISPKTRKIIKNSSTKSLLESKSNNSVIQGKKRFSVMNLDCKKITINTAKTLERIYSNEKFEKFKRKKLTPQSKKDGIRSHTPNPFTKEIKLKILMSLQKNSNDIKQGIKHDIIKPEEKFKKTASKIFHKKKIKFVELKKDIGARKKIPKNNFMNRMIKFQHYIHNIQFLNTIHTDISFNQRSFLCKSLCFSWKDPFQESK